MSSDVVIRVDISHLDAEGVLPQERVHGAVAMPLAHGYVHGAPEAEDEADRVLLAGDFAHVVCCQRAKSIRVGAGDHRLFRERGQDGDAVVAAFCQACVLIKGVRNNVACALEGSLVLDNRSVGALLVRGRGASAKCCNRDVVTRPDLSIAQLFLDKSSNALSSYIRWRSMGKR